MLAVNPIGAGPCLSRMELDGWMTTAPKMTSKCSTKRWRDHLSTPRIGPSILVIWFFTCDDSILIHMYFAEPCQTKSIKAYMKSKKMMALNMAIKKPKSWKSEIMFRFTVPTRDVEEVRLITTKFDFISGVGGNLGLFLGFSIISTLYGIYNLTLKWVEHGSRAAIYQLMDSLFWFRKASKIRPLEPWNFEGSPLEKLIAPPRDSRPFFLIDFGPLYSKLLDFDGLIS